MHKIVLTGPESTGKTTLAKQLAGHFNCPWVPEYAVEYLESLDRPYNYGDLVEIAKGQVKEINRLADPGRPFVFCDTDCINIRIWSTFKYDRVHPWIVGQTENSSVDLYLLCDIDLPWEPHPLREHPHLRETLFELHEEALRTLSKPYSIISGTEKERMERAIKVIRKQFGETKK